MAKGKKKEKLKKKTLKKLLKNLSCIIFEPVIIYLGAKPSKEAAEGIPEKQKLSQCKRESFKKCYLDGGNAHVTGKIRTVWNNSKGRMYCISNIFIKWNAPDGTERRGKEKHAWIRYSELFDDAGAKPKDIVSFDCKIRIYRRAGYAGTPKEYELGMTEPSSLEIIEDKRANASRQ